MEIDEYNLKALSRYSLFDMREVPDSDFDRGEEHFLKSGPIAIIETGEVNLIQWFRVESDGHLYEVRRFPGWGFCSCPDWLFSKSCCKHYCATFSPMCPRCKKNVNIRGEKCSACEADTALYFKPEKPSEKIGGFRI